MLKPLLLLSFLCTLTVSSIAGQNRFPVREHVDPGELVSMNRETSFNQAIQILNDMAMDFEGKFITNKSSMSGSIGLRLPNMPWHQALEYIASYNNLVIREMPDRYEILDYAETAEPDQAREAELVQEETGFNFESREVEISAIFFEGNKRMLREIGIDWSSIRDGMVSVANISAANVSQEVFSVEANISELAGIERYDINALFGAFEANNQGEVLASPTIKVLDGQEGRVQVGQDFSIKQRDFAGNVTDQFFSTGTILEVIPRVVSLGDSTFIFMEIEAERSTAQPDAVSTVVNKQEAGTQILLLSGESTVIAGLYETEENIIRRGIPLLKDLPSWFFGLKYLFGYNSSEYSINELVIVLQAELAPSLSERLNLPYKTMPQQIEDVRRGFQEEIDEHEN
ncbi:MAG: type II and III secretion system protein [Balneolales bacterium]